MTSNGHVYRFEADSGDWWNLAVQPMLADKSDLGLLISEKEFAKIRTFPLPTNITREMSDTLIHRLNNSYYNWDNGILEGENMISYARYSSLEKQIKADKKKVNEVRIASNTLFVFCSLIQLGTTLAY